MINEAKLWVKEVGKKQLEGAREGNFNIEKKTSKVDLVTAIDNLSEQLIIDKIEKNYPEHSILAEEQGAKYKDSDYKWIIDPLDGTNNYANGYPFYGISIAIQYRQKIKAGLVYMPYLNEIFYAVKNKGAYLNDKKLNVSNCNKVEDALLATGFPYDKLTSRINNLNHFKTMVMKARGIRRSGSAAYDLANVAAGRLDGFWEFKLKPWDTAAGKLMIKEAGGKVIDKIYMGAPIIIAGNEIITNQLLKIIKNVKID